MKRMLLGCRPPTERAQAGGRQRVIEPAPSDVTIVGHYRMVDP